MGHSPADTGVPARPKGPLDGVAPRGYVFLPEFYTNTKKVLTEKAKDFLVLAVAKQEDGTGQKTFFPATYISGVSTFRTGRTKGSAPPGHAGFGQKYCSVRVAGRYEDRGLMQLMKYGRPDVSSLSLLLCPHADYARGAVRMPGQSFTKNDLQGTQRGCDRATDRSSYCTTAYCYRVCLEGSLRIRDSFIQVAGFTTTSFGHTRC